MKKNIIITAGGTAEKIDEVRKITNSSTGKLGSLIALEFIKNKDNFIYYICGKGSIQPKESENLKIIKIGSVEELEHEIREVMDSVKIDVFIHSMAISDYTTNKVLSMENLEDNLVDLFAKYQSENVDIETLKDNIKEVLNKDALNDGERKISSSNKELIVTLKQTTKIIGLIKELQPHTFLVGFKLLNNVTETELFDTAFKLLRKNKCNLVLANDIHSIREGKHIGLLVYPEKTYEKIEGKMDITRRLVEVIEKRSNVKYPKSIKREDSFEIDKDVLNLFQRVGKFIFDKGLLPMVEGGTYGNLSQKIDENSFFITGRNIDKGNIDKDSLCLVDKVTEVENENIYSNVFYNGKVKPSIDTSIHAEIYKKTEFKNIIHVHTNKIFEKKYLTSYNYPCGVKEERDSIVIPMLKGDPRFKGSLDVIQMKQHGLIIASESFEGCIVELSRLFSGYINFDDKITNLAWDKWVEHYHSITKNPQERFLNKDNFKSIRLNQLSEENEVELGVVFMNVHQDILQFVVYSFPRYHGKRINIGKRSLEILTKIAKSDNLNKLQVLTAKDCGVEEYYKKINFYQVAEEKDTGIIILEKRI